MKVNNLEIKVMSPEINGNHLEQYGTTNILEITGIPNDVSDKNLDEKKSKVLVSFRSTSQVLKLKLVIALVKVEIRQKKNKKKKTIVRFINRKHAKKALINGKSLIKINQSSLSSDHIFINENLTPVNNKIAFHCRKLKRNGQIDKTYSRDGEIHIASRNIMGK